MPISECCQAEAGDYEEAEMCPDCHEACSWVEEDEDEHK